MRRVMIAVLAVLLPASLALATRQPTVAPVYYLIDYGPNHLDNPQYVEWVRQLPPELLHFGKDVPMTHVFGPIAAVGGENQAHGRNRADIRRLSPAEVRERIAKLQAMNKALHEAGAKMVMPYISAITYGGDPKTREGFFNFFDHWNEYAEFGIGPKPKTDPVDWAAHKADGSFCTFGKELAPPYYAGMNRYVACIEHPDWRRWLEEVTRLVAVAGYDGAFPDNSSPVGCYAPCCQAAFAKYLAEKFTPDQLQELFGTRDAANIKLPEKRGGLLWVEANRFWQTSLARHLDAMRAAGRRVNPKFLLFPNLGTPEHSAEYLAGHVDYIMFEGGGTGPEGAGCVTTPIIGNVGRKSVIDNILDYRYCADIPGDIRPMLLKLGRTPAAQKLCLAEAAAFGSGAFNGATIGTREVQRPYIEFFLRHKAIFEGRISGGRVALLFFPMRDYYPDAAHHACAVNMKNRLGAMQVPFDCFSEVFCLTRQAETLRTYDVCIAPEMKYLSDEHLGILRDYVSGGGRLVVIGEFATHDELCRKRPAPDWLPQAEGERRIGKGAVVCRSATPTPSEMQALLSPAGELRLVVHEGGSGEPMLRVMMYQSADDQIVHLLNYNCPVEGGTQVVPEKDVRVRVPVPEGKSPVSVTSYNPEAGESPLKFETREGVCCFTVPEVAIYVLCRVKMQ